MLDRAEQPERIRLGRPLTEPRGLNGDLDRRRDPQRTMASPAVSRWLDDKRDTLVWISSLQRIRHGVADDCL